MSDEEGSISEGFSASEDEWKPSKDMQQRGGESSDDDDSDFEDSPVVGSAGGNIANRKRESEPKNRSIKQAGIAAKKRKPMGQSLRTKLYNKYRPPPKTFPSPGGSGGNNSPSASTSRTASKNARAPNESSLSRGGDDGNDSSSESSVEDYLVNPAELDLQSSFFNVGGNKATVDSAPAPVFDCNAGMGNLSDSGSEDNNESSAEERSNTKAFDFRNLLEKANSLERAKDAIAKRAADAKTTATSSAVATTAATMDDVSSLLALGETQNKTTSAGRAALLQGESLECGPQKLSKTKSTRVKRHTKTRPTSTVGAGGDSDDSDWEEVAANDTEVSDAAATQTELSRTGLEIYVELPSKHRKKEDKKQQDLELALRRKLNRDLKERQLLLHKTSLLCQFGRSIFYNRLLNDTQLMQAALKFLPSQNAYPEEVGSSVKYYQSLMTWFKTAIKLKRHELYPEKQATKRKSGLKTSLLAQIKRKEADSKQDMVCIFVILLRGMGLQCRLVVNMQPLPLRPAQADLLTIKLKRDASDDIKEGSGVSAKKPKTAEDVQGLKMGKEKATETKTKTEDKNIESEQKLHKRKESNMKEKPKQREQKVIVKEKKVVEKGAVKEKMVTQAPEVKEKEKKGEEKPRAKPTLSKLKRPQADTKADTDVKKLKLSVLSTAKAAIAFTPVARRTRRASTEQRTTASEKPIIELDAVKLPQVVLQGVQEISSKAAKAEVENEKLTITATTSSTATATATQIAFTPVARRTRQASTEHRTTVSAKPIIEVGAVKLPQIVLQGVQEISNNAAKAEVENEKPTATTSSTDTATQKNQRCTRSRSRSKSPQIHISTAFLQNAAYKAKFGIAKGGAKSQRPATRSKSKSPNSMVKISTDFLHVPQKRILRSRQKGDSAAMQQTSNSSGAAEASSKLNVPQLDGGDDGATGNGQKSNQKSSISKRPQLKKLQNSRGSKENSDDDFQPTPTKKPKRAPVMPKKDRRVISSDEEDQQDTSVESAKEASSLKRSATAADLWVELWSDVEEQWICVDLFKGKLNSVEAIRKSASSNLAYVFAFQNNLSVKDVTARYCSNWTSTVRKSRVEKAWLDKAIAPYLGCRTPRDLREDQELRRIHEEKPMPNTISEYKDHPLYVLERHLLKFQAIYPPDPPTLGFVRGEAVYSRDCVHTLHSREIWLKQARTVKLGEQPYKIVKARPKWDRLTQTVIKDQPLEIFGYWQTQDYEPPTAENGVVPRNAYGNVELFKECMLPKKTVHLRLTGLNRVCKKLNIDCANAVIGFDFHQGACHPMFDGFVICEEFAETVTAAWHQDQEEQERKEQEKYEARVYGNWKKLIRGLLIRERLKKKYNF